MKKYWSSRIQNLVPYTPGEQPKNRKFIKLNTNENPFPPSDKVLTAIKDNVNESLKLYPDPESSTLVNKLAEFYNVNAKQIFVGNGSDEVLAFAFQAFYGIGDTIVFPDITYSFYPVYADMFGINYKLVPLNDDFTMPVEKMLGNNNGVVITNPNAPTGIELPQDKLIEILEANKDVVVIVDEAYIDFGGTSALPLLDKYPNLLIVQTMSKSRSLAGLRVGYAFGSENLIQAMNCVKNSINSYTLDRLAIVGGTAAVEDKEYFDYTRHQIAETRDTITVQLEKMGFTVLPSKSNFIFISHKDKYAKDLFLKLRENGILVRYFDKPRINNFLRVTIGKHEDMQTFCDVMEKLVCQKPMI